LLNCCFILRYYNAKDSNRSCDMSTCIVCESLAWPRISSKAGSETKKKRGNNSRFFSKYLQTTQQNNNHV